MNRMDAVVNKLIGEHKLRREELVELLYHVDSKEVMELLQKEALRLRHRYYGHKVYARGLIEFTNYCKNNCYYCGIQRDNHKVNRYRLSQEEILSCCEEGYGLGYRTFVLQGGEDPYYTDEYMVEIITSIRRLYPDCAITLSMGERSRESYRLFRQAGADRYLLRHETASEAHYASLHPGEMSLAHRKQCLYDLKELGYQVGAGMMVGTPGQTMEDLAEDFVFLQELHPHMVGIGPFIPHKETRYGKEKAGSVELTLALLAITRIFLPKVLLPATTALGTLDSRGREKGLLVGCNVVMPNLSPVKYRKDYELYDNKICTGEESAQCVSCIGNRVAAAGYEIVMERGDCIEH